MTNQSDNKEFLPISETGSPEQTDTSDAIPEIEDYQILDKLGHGAMGVIWRAVQLSTKREVALKIMGQGLFGSEKAQARFEREVELAACLDHPNIARIFDSGLYHGLYYYAMELIDGQPLDKYVEHQELTQRQILELMQRVCQAVNHAHQRLVIHRDLKPSNILVTKDGQPYVLDFGLAKALLVEENDKEQTISIEGEPFGTPPYMSPEQAAGDIIAIDTRTDVYSLGVILYRLLTSKWPLDVSGPNYEVLMIIREQEPIRPSKVIPHFDTDLEAILLKTLAKKPCERYQSVSELAQDIQCWLEGLPITARPINALYLFRKFVARHRAVSAIVGLLAVIIVSNSFISLYSYNNARGALKELQSKQDAFEKTAVRNLKFAHQVVFALFLELWHDGKTARAQGAVINFAEDSQERMAALFLLDPRPLDEKKADFQAKLSAEQPSFWEFVLGEYHLKNKDMPATIEAYKRCLERDQDSSELDDWFINRAKRKLDELLPEDELLHENVQLKCNPTINDGE